MGWTWVVLISRSFLPLHTLKFQSGKTYHCVCIVYDVSGDELDEQESVHQKVEDKEPDNGFTQKPWLVELNVAKVKRLKIV